MLASSESKKNPKLIYAYINNQRTTIDKIKALLNENGELTSNKKEIVDLLNLKFHEAFIRDNGDVLPNFQTRCESKCAIDMKSFSSSQLD